MEFPRAVPLDIDPTTFRTIGHRLVDRIADVLATLPARPVTHGESPSEIRAILTNRPLPPEGVDPGTLIDSTCTLLTEHSLFNGHPAFYGYITSSPAPIGALGDFLAAALNPNVGSFQLSPMATEIEAQTVRWIAEMIGFPNTCGGLLVSGGNMANMVCVLTARAAKADWDVRSAGMKGLRNGSLRIYASTETHTWIQKTADLVGLGTEAIRWIPVDENQRLKPEALRAQIRADKRAGDRPFLAVGTAGTVSTGAVDPLKAIAQICREEELWFHVDGAYGAIAAVLPDAEDDLKALGLADSVAVDPHKWLYAPLEAGCSLVRNPDALRDAFSFQPPYYRFEDDRGEPPINFFEQGPQNSRGFRALKVWLCLQQAGRNGYVRMLSDDIALSKELFEAVRAHPELQAFTQGLSIATFRYVPDNLTAVGKEREEYLNALNTELLTRLQQGGEAYLSNALIGGTFLLRTCIVNFRTTRREIHALPGIVVRLGREVDRALRA
jgi:glutamate/tyrosine decarboxylase-like PLP-dependent enzyme